MNEESTNQKVKRLSFTTVFVISILLFDLGFVLNETLRWSDPSEGFKNGILHIIILGPVWSIHLIPWGFLVFALYRWRKWERYRPLWLLAPSVLLLFVAIGSLVFQPPTPLNRFKSFAKTELPMDVQNLHYHFIGGGIADYRDTYYFETKPVEVDRLIRDMRLQKDEVYGHEGMFRTSVSGLDDCPDFLTWAGALHYRGRDDRGRWFYSLITDETRTKVYINIAGI